MGIGPSLHHMKCIPLSKVESFCFLCHLLPQTICPAVARAPFPHFFKRLKQPQCFAHDLTGHSHSPMQPSWLWPLASGLWPAIFSFPRGCGAKTPFSLSCHLKSSTNMIYCTETTHHHHWDCVDLKRLTIFRAPYRQKSWFLDCLQESKCAWCPLATYIKWDPDTGCSCYPLFIKEPEVQSKIPPRSQWFNGGPGGSQPRWS